MIKKRKQYSGHLIRHDKYRLQQLILQEKVEGVRVEEEPLGCRIYVFGLSSIQLFRKVLIKFEWSYCHLRGSSEGRKLRNPQATHFIREIKSTVTVFLPLDCQDGIDHDWGCWSEKAVGFTEGERFNGDE